MDDDAARPPPLVAQEDEPNDDGGGNAAPPALADNENTERDADPPKDAAPPALVQTYRVVRVWPARRLSCAVRFCCVPWLIAVLVLLWPATCVHFLRDRYASREDVASSGVCPFAAAPFEAVVAPDSFYPPSALPNYSAPLSVVEPCTPRFVQQLPVHGNGLVCEYGSRASPRFPAFVAYRCSPGGEWWEYPDNCHLVRRGRPVAYFNGSGLWPAAGDALYVPGPDVAAVVWFKMQGTSRTYSMSPMYTSAASAASYLSRFAGLPLAGIVPHLAAACLPRGALDHPAVVHMALRLRRSAPPLHVAAVHTVWAQDTDGESLGRLLSSVVSDGTYGLSEMVLSPARVLYNALWIMHGIPEKVVHKARPGEFNDAFGEVFESVHTLTALVRSRLIVEHAHACWALAPET